MKDKILEEMKRLGGRGVSMAELSRIDGFEGQNEWGALEKNIVFWANMSDEAADAMNELVSNKSIEVNPTNPIVYFIDGYVLKYPIAKQAKTYKKPHWLPVSLSLSQR